MKAILMIPVVRVLLRRYGLGRTQALLARWARSTGQYVDPRRVIAPVEIASRGVWKANCLQRSLVAWWLLRRRGLAPELRIGVTKGLEGALAFHAWLELDGVVINDSPDVLIRYLPFGGVVSPSLRFDE